MVNMMQFQFCLLRYVPDPIRGEYVNIGVLLYQDEPVRHPALRMTDDWCRVRGLHPEADVGMLIDIGDELQRLLPDPTKLRHMIESCTHHCFQIVTPKACFGTSSAEQLAFLFELYVDCRSRRSTYVDGASFQIFDEELKDSVSQDF